MTHQVTPLSSSLLTWVDQQTAINKGDGYVAIGAKMSIRPPAAITLCVLAALECLIRATILISCMPIAFIAPGMCARMATRTKESARNIFLALGTIFRVRAKEVEPAWKGEHGQVAVLKKTFNRSYLALCNCVKTPQCALKVAVGITSLAACAFAAYKGYHTFDAIQTVFKHRLLVPLGLSTPTRWEFGAQLFNHATSLDYQQCGKTLTNMTRQYPYGVVGGLGGCLILGISLIFFKCKKSLNFKIYVNPTTGERVRINLGQYEEKEIQFQGMYKTEYYVDGDERKWIQQEINPMILQDPINKKRYFLKLKQSFAGNNQ